MSRLILRRLGLGILTLWFVSLVVFVATQALSGDAATAILGRTATPERLAALRSQLHLDDPVWLQYAKWLGGLLTGDLGVEDEDGYLWYKSRKDDVISSMGYRIGPGEIEESLMGHPAVAMCAVIGLRDEIRGQVPAAFVVTKPGVASDDALIAELQDHVRTRLAAHEVPRTIEFVDDLPRTTTGKIMRRALRVDAQA